MSSASMATRSPISNRETSSLAVRESGNTPMNGDSPVSSQDRSIFVKQRYGARVGFGPLPALVIVDFVNGFRDGALFGGPEIAKAMEHTAALLHSARNAKVPVIMTRIVFADGGSDIGLIGKKVP